MSIFDHTLTICSKPKNVREKGTEHSGVYASSSDIIAQCGLDAYLFLRYLKTLLKIYVPLAVLILPTLIPLNLVGGRGRAAGVTGLDQFSWTNVSPKHTNRYWAHLVLAVVVVLWVCRISRLELLAYTRLRHGWLTSCDRLDGASTTTTSILVTDIPVSMLTEAQLKAFYEIYPYGVRSISIHRDCAKLTRDIHKRDACAIALEASETKLIQRAQLAHLRRPRDASPLKIEQTSGGPLWRRYLNDDERKRIRVPRSRAFWLPTLPFLGVAVDEIDHYRSELTTLNASISLEQQKLETSRPIGSAFVHFNRPIGAHMACQALQHPRPHTMLAQPIEESLQTILWQHVSMKWWERYLRTFTVGIAIGALILVCTVPVAFTGLLSQMNYLIRVYPGLSRLEKLPNWLLVVLQGVLPPCLLALVMILLPPTLYSLVAQQGICTQIDLELLVQDYYFYFLFIQIFLVVSVSSSVAAVLSGLTQDVTSIAALLAQELPKSGNYFFSYMLLQGLSVSAASLLQIGRLLSLLMGLLLDNTARQKWARQLDPEVKWGTFFPVYTNLAVIGKRRNQIVREMN